MANKNSRYELKPYVSMYTDPKTVQTAEVLRNRWEKGRQEYDLLQRTAGMTKVGNGDQWIKDEALGNISSNLSQVVQNNNFENAGAAISSSVNQFATNPKMLAALQTQKVREEYEAEKRKRVMNGEQILFDQEVVMDPQTGQPMLDELGQPVMQDRFETHTSWIEGEDGEMKANIYEPQGETKLGWDEKQLELVKNIAEDPVFLQELDASKSDVYGYLMHGKQISKQKANMIAEKMADIYMTTNEGLQQTKWMTSTQIDENGNLLDPAAAKAQIVEQMKMHAHKQIGSDLSYMKNDYLHEEYKNNLKNAPTSTSTTINTKQDILGGKVETIASNLNRRDIYTIADIIKKDENGNIDFTNFTVGDEGKDLEAWYSSNVKDLFDLNGVDQEFVKYLYGTDIIPTDLTGPNTGDVLYKPAPNAKPQSIKKIKQQLKISAGLGDEKATRLLAKINSIEEEHATQSGNEQYFTDDGNYNFNRNYNYRDVYSQLEKDHPEWDNKKLHSEAVKGLHDSYKDVIAKHGKDGHHTSVKGKMTKAYMDEYMGYILTNQEGVRFAKNSNGENVFGNDQEFLNWHAKQIEQYETAGYQAIGGNTNWSESTAKYYKLGKLTLDGGKFNGKAYVNVNGELKEATSIKQLAEEWAKDDNNKLNDVRIAGKTTAWCIQNNNSCKNENNTRSLIHQAMNGTGVQFQGIMPGGKNSGSFKVRVKVNAETTGDENYEGEFYVDFEMPGTASMKSAFRTSHAMHTVVTEGKFDQYGADNPVGQENMGNGMIRQTYFEFDADSKSYLPVMRVIDNQGNQVPGMYEKGGHVLQKLMNSEIDAFSQRGGEISSLIGLMTKGAITNPE